MTRHRPRPSEGPSALDPKLEARLETLFEEGQAWWYRFDAEVRDERWHPFVAADYNSVLAALLAVRRPGLRFLEWGSGTGVITIMADLLDFDACGIELDPSLVEVARDLALRWASNARFATGSFLPMGWEWRNARGDARPGTLGDGPSGYLKLGRPLDDFDVVYGYPWMGEEPLMLDLMRSHGGENAILLIHSPDGETNIYQGGQRR